MAFSRAVALSLVTLAAVTVYQVEADLYFPVLEGTNLEKGAENSSVHTPEANSDRILNLPGLDYDPGFNQYSGYLEVSKEHGRRIFFWFVESQGDPKNDPVLFWTNGGPGCSGLLGLGTEHGPFLIDVKGKLTPNPHSWNQVANILYVEQPAGVGFSFSDTESDYDTDDQQAASDNYVLIRQFLERFPERQSNDFYIASESYGGHYMPELTLEILKRNTDGLINFRGFMVGNPFVDPHTNTLTQFRAYYYHGLVAKPLYDEYNKRCSDPSNFSPVTCRDLQDEIYAKWGDSINRYALDYPVCREKADTSNTRPQFPSLQAMLLMGGMADAPDRDVYHPCETAHLIKYLNRDNVQAALHTKATNWTICAKGVVRYHRDGLSKIHLYRELVDMGRKGEHSLNILVYSGDDDSVCSTAGTQEWIYDLGVDPMKGLLWKPWRVEEQTAGYVTHFDLGNSTEASFTFATVHGGGHEVPAYRPIEALQMFKIYLRGEW